MILVLGACAQTTDQPPRRQAPDCDRRFAAADPGQRIPCARRRPHQIPIAADRPTGPPQSLPGGFGRRPSERAVEFSYEGRHAETLHLLDHSAAHSERLLMPLSRHSQCARPARLDGN